MEQYVYDDARSWALDDDGLHSCLSMIKNLDRVIDERRPKCSTGVPTLDAATQGGIASELMIVGARSGVGKTDLACDISVNLAKTRKVIYLTGELAPDQIFLRAFLSFANQVQKDVRITEERLCERRHDDEVFISCTKSRFAAIASNLCIADDTTLNGTNDYSFTIEGLRELISSYRRNGVECALVVDYLQQLRSSKLDGSSTVELLDHVAKQLASLAHTEHVPIIALTSLSQQNEPRGSAHILHAADIYLHLETESSLQGRRVRPVTGHLKKNRNGASGIDLEMTYTPELHLFE